MAPRSRVVGFLTDPSPLWKGLARRKPSPSRKRHHRSVAVEALESRALLAVSAGLVGSELLVNLSEADDSATLQVEGSSYTVRSGTQTLGSYSVAAVNAIRVTGDLGQPRQSLVIKPGGVVADPLTVDAGVDATLVGAAIATTGSVRIDSATLTLAQDVRTSGDQTYTGLVRLANDIVLDAGNGNIRFAGEIRSTVGPRASVMEDIGAPYRLALAPNGQTLYASDAISNFIYFIDLAAQQLDTVDLGKSVGNLVLSPNGNRLYVANTYDDSVTVLDTASRGTLATIGVVGTPEGMAFSADGQTLYVANYSENSIAVINTVTNQLSRTIAVQGNPTAVAVAPDGRLWVASETRNRVSVIHPTMGTVLSEVVVGRGPADVALSPDGTRAYVANNFANTISVIDTATAKVIATLAAGNGPTEIAVAANGGLVYVVNGFSDDVTVIDTVALAVATTVPVGSLPVGITLSADGKTAYVANLNSLSELGNDPRSLTVRTTGIARFDAAPSTVDPLRALIVEASRELESAGTVTLSVDTAGNLRANGTRITFNGGPVSYQGMAAGGWTAVAAEQAGGVNTVVLRHSCGALHFWRLDAGWRQTAGEGWVAPRTTEFYAAETAFGTDFDGDTIIGSPITTLESSGSVTLAYDGAGNLLANGQLVTFNNAPFRHTTDPNAVWRAMAADVDRGVNTLVLKHSSGFLHFWRMDANWRQVSGDGWVAPGSATFYATELAFDADLDGDGRVMIEAAGGVALGYDGGGNLRVNDAVVTFNGAPINYHGMVAAGWTAMAAEVDRGVQTVVLKHASGNLHFWRMDANWSQVSGDGWVAPGTNDFFGSEVTYGVDLDGDGVLTIETAGDVIFAYDADGNITANGTPVIFNGGPMSYYGMIAAGWRARAADSDRGVNTVVLEHSSGFLHFWRMDADWRQVSGDGWVAPGSREFFVSEAAFGADLNGDGIRTVEAAGSVILTYDRVGHMRSNGSPFIFDGIPFNYYGAVAAGWLIAAADVSQGQNTVVLRHAASGFLHFWRMQVGTWNQATADGWVAPGSAEFFATELSFGVDIDRNGTIGG
jgi:YVTN family beta-propeller protein